MATTTLHNQSRFSIRSQGRQGVIGIDVGTTTIKVAHIERIGARYRMLACQLLPISATSTSLPGDSDDGDLPRWPFSEIQSFRSKVVAATLPRNLVVFRTLQLPAGSDSEIRQLVEQELIQSSDDEQVFDFWTSATDTSSPRPESTNPHEISVASVSKDVANQLGRGLHTVGLTCNTLDATPFAMARAIGMMKGNRKNSSVLAVDLGETATSITLVANGQPVLFRELRDSGMRQITSSLMEGLKLAQADCQLLLRSPGLQPATTQDANSSGSELRHAIVELTHKATSKVVDELQRTFRFVSNGTQSPPKKVVLLGAGADITGMDRLISTALSTPAERWSIATSENLTAPTHLFGQAAGLSALTVMT